LIALSSFIAALLGHTAATQFPGEASFVSPSYGQVFDTAVSIPFALQVKCPSHTMCFEIICFTIDRKWYANRDASEVHCLPRHQIEFEMSGFEPGTHTVHAALITAAELEQLQLEGKDLNAAFATFEPSAISIFETLPTQPVLDYLRLSLNTDQQNVSRQHHQDYNDTQHQPSQKGHPIRVGLLNPVSTGTLP
jgi:hypothetical protein